MTRHDRGRLMELAQMSKTVGRMERNSRGFAIAGLLLALVYFVWRAVARGLVDSTDLAVGFSAGGAWLQGADPYSASALADVLARSGGGELVQSQLLERLQNVYAPSTLPAFLPLATLPWPAARLVFLGLNVVGVVVVIACLVRLLGWRPLETRSIVLAAFALALSPVHTTIASGQMAILATATLLVAVVLGQRGHPHLSGVGYGLATILKLQIGLPFIAFLVWQRRWSAALVAFALIGGAGLIAIARMELAGSPWLASWFANLGALSSPGGINDPSPLNPERYSLVNLQVVLHGVAPNSALVEPTAIGLIALASLAMVWIAKGNDREELLLLSFVAVAGLLVAYHRYYDAVLLAFPVAWAIAAYSGPRRPEAIAVLLLAGDFILPAQTAVHDLQQDQRIPGWLAGAPGWDAVVTTQHVWALILIALVLLVAAARGRAAASQAGG